MAEFTPKELEWIQKQKANGASKEEIASRLNAARATARDNGLIDNGAQKQEPLPFDAPVEEKLKVLDQQIKLAETQGNAADIRALTSVKTEIEKGNLGKPTKSEDDEATFIERLKKAGVAMRDEFKEGVELGQRGAERVLDATGASKKIDELGAKIAGVDPNVIAEQKKTAAERVQEGGVGVASIGGGALKALFGSLYAGVAGFFEPEIQDAVESTVYAARNSLIEKNVKNGMDYSVAEKLADEDLATVANNFKEKFTNAKAALADMVGGDEQKATDILLSAEGAFDAFGAELGKKPVQEFGKEIVETVPKIIKTSKELIEGGIQSGKNFFKELEFIPINEAEKVVKEAGFINIGGTKIPTAEPTLAGGILQRMHRPIPTKAEAFAKQTGKPMGEWLVERGIVDTPEKTVQKLFDRYKTSMAQVDKGFEAIPGRFNDPVLRKVGKELLDLERDVAAKGAASRDKKLIENLVKNLDGDGLSMQEVNTLKRLYERKIKTEYIKDSTKTSSEIQAKTNLDSKLREWQAGTAKELGFDDLASLNRETMETRSVLDAVGERYLRAQSNNAISLTDWVVATGASVNPSFLGTLIGKKLITSDQFQKQLAKLFATGKKTVGEPEIKSLESIKRKAKIKAKSEEIKANAGKTPQ